MKYSLQNPESTFALSRAFTWQLCERMSTCLSTVTQDQQVVLGFAICILQSCCITTPSVTEAAGGGSYLMVPPVRRADAITQYCVYLKRKHYETLPVIKKKYIFVMLIPVIITKSSTAHHFISYLHIIQHLLTSKCLRNNHSCATVQKMFI